MGGLQINSADARRRQRQRQLHPQQQAVLISKPKTGRKNKEQTPKKRRSKKFHNDDYEPRRERHNQRREYRSDRESRRRNRSSSRDRVVRANTSFDLQNATDLDTTVASTSFDQQPAVGVLNTIFEDIGHAAANAAGEVGNAILHAIFPVHVDPDEEETVPMSAIGEESILAEGEATAVGGEEESIVSEKPKKKRGFFGLKRLQKSVHAKKAEDMDVEEKKESVISAPSIVSGIEVEECSATQEQTKNLKEKEEVIIMESKKLEASEREVDEMNANFTKREEELSKRLAAIQAGEEERRQKEREIEEQAKLVAAREQSILERLAAAEEASVSRRKKESKLEEREQELSDRLAAIDAASVARRKEEQVIKGKLTSLAKREQAIDERLASLDSVIASQKREVKKKEIEMEEARKLKELHEKELLITEKNKALEEAMQLNMQRESGDEDKSKGNGKGNYGCVSKTSFQPKHTVEVITLSYELPLHTLGRGETASFGGEEVNIVPEPSQKKRGFVRRLRQKKIAHAKKKSMDGVVANNTKKQKSDKKEEKTKTKKPEKPHSSSRTEASDVAAKTADDSEELDGYNVEGKKDLKNKVKGDAVVVATDDEIIKKMSPEDGEESTFAPDEQSVVSFLNIESGQTSWTKTGLEDAATKVIFPVPEDGNGDDSPQDDDIPQATSVDYSNYI